MRNEGKSIKFQVSFLYGNHLLMMTLNLCNPQYIAGIVKGTLNRFESVIQMELHCRIEIFIYCFIVTTKKFLIQFKLLKCQCEFISENSK